MVATVVPEAAAEAVPVHHFRLLFQWPLVLCAKSGSAAQGPSLAREVRAVAASDDWEEIDAAAFPPKGEAPGVPKAKRDGGPYGEFVYFHDFAQSFLYPPKGGGGSFRLFERTDIRTLRAYFKGFDLAFEVARLTLHMFDTGVAIMSLELSHVPQERPLTLDRCQTAIDALRRTYVPFWEGLEAQRVPWAVELNGRRVMAPPCPKAAERMLEGTGAERNPRVFEHWRKMIKPLKLVGEPGGLWRDPSDERMPVNSFLSLTHPAYGALDHQEKRGEATKAAVNARKAMLDRAALWQIKDSDWARLWDAEEAGGLWPYNPRFAQGAQVGAYYDRFYPDERSGGLSVRHIFGGAHYSYVGAGWFTDNIGVHHWRRHYAQLSLIARFQVASLLALSSRITRALDLRTSRDPVAFETELLQIQDAFLEYRHRFHFTGVSG